MGRPKIDHIDAAIIRLLESDARLPMATIAGRVNVPKSTVRHRINRLVQQRIIEFAATTNPLQLGYEVWVVIDLRVRFGQIEAVAKHVAEAPEVHFVGIMTGSRDLLVGAVFRSNAELLDFLALRLAKIRGINETSTSTVLKIVKRTVSWPLPGDGQSPRTRPRDPLRHDEGAGAAFTTAGRERDRGASACIAWPPAGAGGAVHA